MQNVFHGLRIQQEVHTYSISRSNLHKSCSAKAWSYSSPGELQAVAASNSKPLLCALSGWTLALGEESRVPYQGLFSTERARLGFHLPDCRRRSGEGKFAGTNRNIGPEA